ncbi:alanine--tRNA ligase [Candidatus Beckwithbacteria bacterium CG23_combo_of_CG06-09_8_20_14_all_34_8]|uniref:alanine--tRNA ligase n=1 Tax=Candidatus Beckwithbacteria bacterium CG23_combo_of_CG06-09_8_20_14_all_34_8 TaxID=1974497 RepID=A0A2H0B5G2_9BACT|nr:MAG: alanine--tRNA ligase [Candidatus Beckwithbacteria bacterium CG23_combo_of_CG06-09_8_20_14_all_34_8]
MDHDQLRQKYLDFFKSKGHAIIAPAKLVPENDPTTLFTSSGMQQLVPNLKGEPNPMGVRLTDSQPSFRAEDIEEVGDNRHTTFFEMLGNWSLGDYFKKEQLAWFFSFLVNEIKLDPTKLFVTIFKGDKIVSRDTESELIWREQFQQILKPFLKIGIKEITVNYDPEKGIDISDRIFYYSAKKNWWSRSGTPDKMPVGEIGGPDNEVFYDFGAELKLHENSIYKDQPCHPNCDCGRFLEIGNSVFMQYEKLEDGTFKPLPKQNVDFGGGLERILMAVQNKQDMFETSIFYPVIEEIIKATEKSYESEYKPMMRTIADHVKAATFMISEGIEPSNKQQGYICRRLLRRAAVKVYALMGEQTDPTQFFTATSQAVRKLYDGVYFTDRVDFIDQVISDEVAKFIKTLKRGIAKIEKTDLVQIDGAFAFNLFQTDGIPFEITQEVLSKKGVKLSQEQFDLEFSKHKDQSRTASKGMFAGGLADHSEQITELHTATHLLNQALRIVLGREDIMQVGSNITAERLRFDFTYPDKLTDEQIKQVEDIVNEQIKKDLLVSFTVMDKDEALKVAVGAFSERYGDKVKVYSVGDPSIGLGQVFSREICGGPHVERTGVLGHFEIGKQEAVGAGKRRVYGYLK